MPPPPVVLATSPVQFVFKRGGGAVVHGRLSVWSGVGTADEKRVLVLFFEDSLDDLETFTRQINLGIYTCVLQVFVRDDLNGRYDYEQQTSGQTVAIDNGNLGAGGQGQGLMARHEYVLSVE